MQEVLMLPVKSKYSNEAIRNAFLKDINQLPQQKMVKTAIKDSILNRYEYSEIKTAASSTAQNARSSIRQARNGFFTSVKDAIAGHKILSGIVALGTLLVAGVSGKKAYESSQAKKLDKAA